MDEALIDLVRDLKDECEWTQQKWMQCKLLYASGSERLALLNEVAPNFFYVVQQMFFVDAMLHLSRITDPPRAINKERRPNLTIRAIPELIKDEGAKATVEAAIGAAQRACGFARRWRDRWIAHSDLHTVRNLASEIPATDVMEVDRALVAVRDVIAIVEKIHGQWQATAYIDDPWGAKALVQRLASAARA
jgi:hypothetical protein